MILQALYNYYQVLQDDPEVEIAEPGYSAANVSFTLNLSPEGQLLDIIPLPSKIFDGKKTRDVDYQRMIVPEQIKRSGISPKPNFLWDNSAFVLGISDKNQDDPEYNQKRFIAFRDFNIEILSQADSDIARSVIAFLQKHNPQEAREQEVIQRYLDDLLKGGYLIFRVQGEDVLVDPEIRRVWEEHRTGEKAVKMQCLVTGEIEPIARLHPSIQGVSGAKSTGASLISFDDPSFQSYNRKDADTKGLNSPVSRRAASGYGVALNYLLSNQNPNRKIHLGDTTVVYWADTADKRYASAFYAFLNPAYQQAQEDEAEETKGEGKQKRAKEKEKQMGEVAESVQQGKAIDLAALSNELDKDTRFYVLGLAPSAARLAVRFYLTERFGVFAERIKQHYDDLKIEKERPNQQTYISPYRILAECVSPKVTHRDDEVKKSWSLLGGALMRSILTGVPYPEGLNYAIINRIRSDHEINYVRSAVMKAFLIRKYRNQPQHPIKEVLSMALNEQATIPAYLLGRLFAVLEKAQRDAAAPAKLNATIKDRYFTSACATPASVFPVLLRLSQHHISKAKYGYYTDQKIEAIMDRLDIANNPFPAHLTLDEQGIFVLGYYHQRAAFPFAHKNAVPETATIETVNLED